VLPQGGRLDARASSAFPADLPAQRFASRVNKGEQSNTSLLFGDRLFLKLFRRLQAEENPDVEMGRFLTEVAHFSRIPPFLGEISMSSPGSQKTTVAMLQGLVPNQGDGWRWFLDELSQWFPQVVGRPVPQIAPVPDRPRRNDTPRELASAKSTLDAAALLGRCTAEMHLALASSADLPAFAPEQVTPQDLARDADRIEAQIKSTLEALKVKLATFDDPTTDSAGLLLSRRPELIRRARSITALKNCGQRIRIHGDYHLGQTLRTAADSKSPADAADFVLIDFEGEPARSIDERRRKQSPLKDVAGMIRSFSYAAFVAVDHFLAAGASEQHRDNLTEWAQRWQRAASAQFFQAYRDAAASNSALLPEPVAAPTLLDAYLIEKALYEMLYELNHRPAWLRIPVSGILAM
jgi:maltose alpha-D-glucosyltransferase/alpha-amylase